MSLQLKVRNIVLAGAFNSLALDKYFFIKSDILQESELVPNSFFSDGTVTQVVTKIFQILITPVQIIITSINPLEDDKIEDTVIKIIKGGSILQLNALGFNFTWNFNDEEKNIHELSKKHFYNDEVKILKSHFNKPDSKFGIYASTNFEDSRLKLDIKPTSTTRISMTGAEIFEDIQFQFNFHIDMPKESKPIEALKYLKDYEKYKKLSLEIIDNYK